MNRNLAFSNMWLGFRELAIELIELISSKVTNHLNVHLCPFLPGRYGDLSESSEQHSRGKANKGHNGSLKKVQFSHQNIRGFSALWDLLHEVHVHLG